MALFLVCAMPLELNIYLLLQGDKENHVASIHPVKMLYIWPYFMFFSFPLLYPYLMNGIIPQGILPKTLRRDSRWPQLPRLTLQSFSIVLMLVVVHFNTTVHPFTLADNRHYMFYVFRLLLHHRLVKYALVPVYFYCAWATIAAFGGINDAADTPVTRTTPNQDDLHDRPAPLAEADQSVGVRTSFFLIWFSATTLSLITAPLVEPRYFIIPWLIWRLHVHSPLTTPNTREAGGRNDTDQKGSLSLFDRAIRSFINSNHQNRLAFETAWFLFINWATTYIFLNWGFEWPQEPGQVQRFMW